MLACGFLAMIPTVSNALGKPLVSCFYQSHSSLSSVHVQKQMKKMEARHKQIRAAVRNNPVGRVVLTPVWGAIPTEIKFNKWTEMWHIIERRDWYTDVKACLPGDFEYDTIEALVSGRLEYNNRRSRNDPKHRAAKNWQQRIIRYREK